MLTFPKVTSARGNPISPNVIRVSDSAFTSWYIQDLMVMKEDIEKYTLSTTEAEHMALSTTLPDTLPIMFLLDELGYRNFQVMCTAPHVYCKAFEDNSETLESARLPKLRPRTKHKYVYYHHYRDYVRSSKVKMFPIGARNQATDALTKALPLNTFVRHRNTYVDSNPRCPSKGV